MTIYATYFDSNFIARGLACLQSIASNSRLKPRFLVLALDDCCAEAIMKLEDTIGDTAELKLLTLDELERTFPELQRVKAERSKIEYFFTLTPFLCTQALRATYVDEYAVYIDADLFFFDDPELAVAAAQNSPVAIVEHRFQRSLQHLALLYGRFNVGWNAFRQSPEAGACLKRWRQQCIDWCGDRPDQGRFADQKYLDDWPETVKSLAVLAHPGIDLGPWNVGGHELTRTSSGELRVDGAPLIFFHFHHLTRLSPSVYEADFGAFGAIGRTLARHVYRPYLEALDRIEARVLAATGLQPEGALARFADHGRWTIPRVLRTPLRAGKLIARRRVVFEKGMVAPPWRSLRYA